MFWSVWNKDKKINHQAQREDLAAELRWAVRMGWQSRTCNHFSLAVDQGEESPAGILINPQGYHWSELTASSLLLMNYEDEVIEGDGIISPRHFSFTSRFTAEYQKRNACYMLTLLTQRQ